MEQRTPLCTQRISSSPAWGRAAAPPLARARELQDAEQPGGQTERRAEQSRCQTVTPPAAPAVARRCRPPGCSASTLATNLKHLLRGKCFLQRNLPLAVLSGPAATGTAWAKQPASSAQRRRRRHRQATPRPQVPWLARLGALLCGTTLGCPAVVQPCSARVCAGVPRQRLAVAAAGTAWGGGVVQAGQSAAPAPGGSICYPACGRLWWQGA